MVVFFMNLLVSISSLSVFVDLIIINLNYPHIYLGFYITILIKFISVIIADPLEFHFSL